MRRRIAILLSAMIALSGCTTADAPILANPPAARPSIPAPSDRPVSRPTDPVPVVLPRDDGPHDRLTEWWYYTGHLRSPGRISPEEDRRFGFEYVIFRAERGDFPTTWASHLAITDENAGRFYYAQRLEVGEGVDHSLRDASGSPTGFDLRLSGVDPSDPATFDRPSWRMTGSNGSDHLGATLSSEEAAGSRLPDGTDLGLGLTLTSRKPPALHDRDGWIDFGAAGSSYYYSRTSMAADGGLTIGRRVFDVSGDAWFDHQWGDFISVGGGGWDWFAVNLDDDTDLTLSLVRDANGSYPLIYGTLVRPDGSIVHLAKDAFSVTVTDRWTSPRTGAEYPAGWTITIPDEELEIKLSPTVADQELDTRATTGVVYWEGSQRVEATRFGEPLGGEGYVELTGYAPSD